jgi:hypothetical protein
MVGSIADESTVKMRLDSREPIAHHETGRIRIIRARIGFGKRIRRFVFRLSFAGKYLPQNASVHVVPSLLTLTLRPVTHYRSENLSQKLESTF